MSLKNLSERLNYALELTGTKKADLARSISIKPQVIQFLCNSKTQSSRFTFEIATALGINTRWLATGEGEIFIADDPKYQILKEYVSIPLLNAHNIREVFLLNKDPNIENIKTWFPLQSQDKHFGIKMMDTSMHPVFPKGAYLFIRKHKFENIANFKYVFLYIKKFDMFVVREVTIDDSDILLVPQNKELFKDIIFNDEVKFLGVITDCYWRIEV